MDNTPTPSAERDAETDAVWALQVRRRQAALVRDQLERMFVTLKNMNLTGVNDTNFRDKIFKAKESIKVAMSDFIIDDDYWQKKVTEEALKEESVDTEEKKD